ncbi:MAG: Efflux ABC transporter, permease protein, partial [uncultured Quadrisphaera sp.]
GASRVALAALELAPGGAAAPAGRRVLAQAGFDARLLLRNGEQLLVSLVLPVLALLLLVRAPLEALGLPEDLAALPPVDVVAPGVLAMAVIGTAFAGQAIQLGFDRRYGVLRLMATTPLGRGGFLAGRLGAVLVVEVAQVLVLGGVAVALGWRPWAAGAAAVVLLVLALLLGTAAFGGLALVLAGTLRAEAVLALANLVFVLLVAGGGVLLPVAGLPGAVGAVAAALPSGALGELTRAAALTGALPLGPVAVLAAWAAVAAALVVRTFRWSS